LAFGHVGEKNEGKDCWRLLNFSKNHFQKLHFTKR